ncbi:MAG: hypothetical protein HY099_01270 [Nitrospirae bacterium]|nr:hypothetical protein [Nitrospirota bacterium]
MREEISGLDKALSEIKAMVSPDFASNTPEVIILVTLDDLKTRMKDAVITISGMEYRADEIILPLNIKAEVRDYAVFVNTVGYLQTLRFPFFNISSITLMQNNERTAVSYEIKGTLSMIKR